MSFFLGIFLVVVVGIGLTLLLCLAWLAFDALLDRGRARPGRHPPRSAAPAPETPLKPLRTPSRSLGGGGEGQAEVQAEVQGTRGPGLAIGPQKRKSARK